MSRVEVATLIISGIALVVSVLSAVATHRLSRRQAVSQEAIVAIEQERDARLALGSARTTVIAYTTSSSTQNQRRLALENAGESQATDIGVEVEGVPWREWPHRVGHTPFPIATLGPRAPFSIPIATSFGVPTHFPIVVTWKNSDGTDGRWESTLSLFT